LKDAFPIAACGKTYLFAKKFTPNNRSGELILMNSRNHVDKPAVETGKRAAFIVVAALALTLPLQSQQSVQESPIDPTTVALAMARQRCRR
jgi:hypothetical protein